MFELSLLVYVAIFTICILYFRRSPTTQFIKAVGGPPGIPFLGNALDLIKIDRSIVAFCQWIDKYGNRLAIRLGPLITIFVVNDAEDLEKILSSKTAIDKSEDYDLARAWLGDGLITSTGQLWHNRRKLLTPTFHFSILESFIVPINVHANILVDIIMEKYILSDDQAEYKDIEPFVARCTLDIICETAMGTQMNSQLEGTSEYVEAINKMGELFQYRSIRPWLRNDFVWSLTSAGKSEKECLKVIHSFTDDVIAERKRLGMKGDTNSVNREDGKTRLAFLDLLVEAQRSGMDISDTGIRDETTTFIFAGHDTVSVAVSFCLFNIGNHPEVQEKLHRELDVIFQGDNDRHITAADVKEMKYLECCIKESLRLFPSVPLVGRLLKQPFKLDEEITIPSGITIFMLPYKIHRNSKYFPKPDEFIPERFAAGSCMANRNPFAYIPFSGGPRNCIGQKYAMMEAKIMLATILRKLKIESQKKSEELDLLAEIVLRARGGICVKFQQR